MTVSVRSDVEERLDHAMKIVERLVEIRELLTAIEPRAGLGLTAEPVHLVAQNSAGAGELPRDGAKRTEELLHRSLQELDALLEEPDSITDVARVCHLTDDLIVLAKLCVVTVRLGAIGARS